MDGLKYHRYNLVLLQSVEDLEVIALMGNQARLHDFRRVVSGVIGIVLIYLQNLIESCVGQKCTADPVLNGSSIDLRRVDLLDCDFSLVDCCTPLRVLIDPEIFFARNVLGIEAILNRCDIGLERSPGFFWLFSMCQRCTNDERYEKGSLLAKWDEQDIRLLWSKAQIFFGVRPFYFPIRSTVFVRR